jgi:hypothetical protein
MVLESITSCCPCSRKRDGGWFYLSSILANIGDGDQDQISSLCGLLGPNGATLSQQPDPIDDEIGSRRINDSLCQSCRLHTWGAHLLVLQNGNGKNTDGGRAPLRSQNACCWHRQLPPVAPADSAVGPRYYQYRARRHVDPSEKNAQLCTEAGTRIVEPP